MILVVHICCKKSQRARCGLASTRATEAEQILGSTDHQLLLRGELEFDLGDALDESEKLLGALLYADRVNYALVCAFEFIFFKVEFIRKSIFIERCASFELLSDLINEVSVLAKNR